MPRRQWQKTSGVAGTQPIWTPAAGPSHHVRLVFVGVAYTCQETATTFPFGPTRLAAWILWLPAPQPRSRTRIPGRTSAISMSNSVAMERPAEKDSSHFAQPGAADSHVLQTSDCDTAIRAPHRVLVCISYCNAGRASAARPGRACCESIGGPVRAGARQKDRRPGNSGGVLQLVSALDGISVNMTWNSPGPTMTASFDQPEHWRHRAEEMRKDQALSLLACGIPRPSAGTVLLRQTRTCR